MTFWVNSVESSKIRVFNLNVEKNAYLATLALDMSATVKSTNHDAVFTSPDFVNQSDCIM